MALVNKIKRTAIIALASDDKLMETLVLKGGNAIDLAYTASPGKVSRTSYDLDYSIESGDFDEELEVIAKRIEKTLVQTFLEQGLGVIDYKFENRPRNSKPELAGFWGGYKATFKVVSEKDFKAHSGDMDKLRRSSVSVNPDSSPVFEMEFSKFEYVGDKAEVNVDGYTIYVYTPEMIVFEKLRAICQQLPDYGRIIPSFSPRARARDFYDIHLIMEMHAIDPQTEKNKELIRHIFEAKKVPLDFISQIDKHRGLHKDNWQSVQDTVSADEVLKPFDYYVDFTVTTFASLTFP